ncbi:carcinine hydrolase/isopenicillin-N N-acyltransferase family protein [Chitinolyticbacter albus]|uniref:carcinine hydrolase/isopenicillin-N N-acyltransferase family protein n=1 Tax=Chitinolyticbacter albus TaxID=2961951 RepID=UPI00210EF69F|nr:C45 family peptidase [Chitinolyticbacter albus]
MQIDAENLAAEREADYRHYRICGTPAELGAAMAAQGRLLLPPAELGYDVKKLAQLSYARDCRALTAEHYPALVAENDAYAQASGMTVDDTLWHYALGVTGGCSGIAVATPQGMVVGRNYDFFYFESRRHLIETRPAAGHAHISMHEGLAGGRFDGMNEHGLFVSFNGAGEHPDPAPVGLAFHHLVRYLLEHCTSVAEARAALLRLPVKEAKSYLLVDAKEACVVEVHPQRRAVREPVDGVLVMTNHFLDPDMVALCPPWPNSLSRMQRLQAGAPHGLDATASLAALQVLLAEHDAPVCGHVNGMATFWSAVAHPQSGLARYCLGAPCRNRWQDYQLGREAQ